MHRRRLLHSLLLAAAGSTLRLQPGMLAARRERRPAAAAPSGGAHRPLRQSDVVFMYQAPREIYRAYDATVLAWGGTPTPASLADASGVSFFGSVGMVTEFARYRERFPARWADGLCRNVHGERIKVPWLTDHAHEGEPFWWCCTRQPVFQEFLAGRVVETIRGGAHGVHVDDHLGSAGALFLEACFCRRCVDGFAAYADALPPPERHRLHVDDAARADAGAVLRAWIAGAPAGEPRRANQHPLWPAWAAYQLRGAGAFIADLRALASRTAGRDVTMSANAGLLWPNHLATHRSLGFFSAEIEHGAASDRPSDRPLFAYRMADAMNRPLASTASGHDWAHVKAQGRAGLVTTWIAGGYAAGHMLMAPHRQWCYTEEKGTHWYDGPTEVFAPLYRFAREHATLLDGFEPWADVVVIMPHASWVATRDRWLHIGEALALAHVNYRLAIGGDSVMEHAISPGRLDGVQAILNPAPDALQSDDRAVVTNVPSQAMVSSVDELLARVRPAVRVEGTALVRALPRVGRDRLVLHLVNHAYDPSRDTVVPQANVTTVLDAAALGVARGAEARVLAPGQSPRTTSLGSDGRLRVDLLGPWTLVVLER
jgi:hypothetical protein